nr:hypothetical protein [Tanacetum cinerariifolium]
ARAAAAARSRIGARARLSAFAGVVLEVDVAQVHLDLENLRHVAIEGKALVGVEFPIDVELCGDRVQVVFQRTVKIGRQAGIAVGHGR